MKRYITHIPPRYEQVPALRERMRSDDQRHFLAEELGAGISDSKMRLFRGGHLFFMMRERQQFLDAVAKFAK